jgi:hypothetical protein
MKDFSRADFKARHLPMTPTQEMEKLKRIKNPNEMEKMDLIYWILKLTDPYLPPTPQRDMDSLIWCIEEGCDSWKRHDLTDKDTIQWLVTHHIGMIPTHTEYQTLYGYRDEEMHEIMIRSIEEEHNSANA